MIETDIHTLKGGEHYNDSLLRAVIYSLINLNNGKRYIGRTRNPKMRISRHLTALRGHYHKNPLLNKDSDCQFGFEILEKDVSCIEESDREVYYIVKYKTFDERFGYNGNDPAIRTTKTREFTRRFKEIIKRKEVKE